MRNSGKHFFFTWTPAVAPQTASGEDGHDLRNGFEFFYTGAGGRFGLDRLLFPLCNVLIISSGANISLRTHCGGVNGINARACDVSYCKCVVITRTNSASVLSRCSPTWVASQLRRLLIIHTEHHGQYFSHIFSHFSHM